MRTLFTIVLGAAMGIHCSAPAESTATNDRDVVADPRLEGTESDGRPERIGLVDEEPESIPKSSHGFVALPTLVLTTVTGPDGATYVAGTYSDTIVINGSTFTSNGKEDVFLARREIDGTIAWARSVGSLSNESGPKLVFEDDHLKLIATTRGEVDCGSGPMGTWNSEMFFMCYFDDAGTSLGGATFPTGAK